MQITSGSTRIVIFCLEMNVASKDCPEVLTADPCRAPSSQVIFLYRCYRVTRHG